MYSVDTLSQVHMYKDAHYIIAYRSEKLETAPNFHS